MQWFASLLLYEVVECDGQAVHSILLPTLWLSSPES